MAVAYVSIWAIYIVIHILLSTLLRYDSLDSRLETAFMSS